MTNSHLYVRLVSVPVAKPRRGPYHYIEEVYTLPVSFGFMASERRRPNLNIGGRLICDVQIDGWLQNFDLMLAKELWQVAPPADPPRPARAAKLFFTGATFRGRVHNTVVRVLTDEARSYAHILFGEPEDGGVWVALTEHCLAWTVGDRLKAFHVAVAQSAP